MLRREPVRPDARDRISVLRLVAYVLPAVPLAALGMPIVVHLSQFYASKEIGLGLVVTGMVFSLMRIFDVLIDPVMGYWSDRWRTRFGRRRPLSRAMRACSIARDGGPRRRVISTATGWRGLRSAGP